MKSYSLILQGSSLIVTITEGDNERTHPFNFLSHFNGIDKDSNTVVLQKDNFILTIPIGQIATYNTYDLIKAQVLIWTKQVSLVSIGKLSKVTDSFTTAVGTTAYSVGDVIAAAGVSTGAGTLRYLDVGCNSGYLTGLAIEMENASPLSTPSPLPTLRVRFFDSSVAGLVVADNAADEVLFANNTRRLGHIDLPIMVADGGRLLSLDENIRFPFANLTDGKLYYKILNQVGTPALGTISVGRGTFIRVKVDQN